MDLILYRSFTKQLGAALMTVVFFLLPIYLYFNGKATVPIMVFMIPCGIIAFTIFIFLVKGMIDKTPKIIIDKQGVYFGKLDSQPIPWSRIRNLTYFVSVSERTKTDYLVITTDDLFSPDQKIGFLSAVTIDKQSKNISSKTYKINLSFIKFDKALLPAQLSRILDTYGRNNGADQI